MDFNIKALDSTAQECEEMIPVALDLRAASSSTQASMVYLTCRVIISQDVVHDLRVTPLHVLITKRRLGKAVRPHRKPPTHRGGKAQPTQPVPRLSQEVHLSPKAGLSRIVRAGEAPPSCFRSHPGC